MIEAITLDGSDNSPIIGYISKKDDIWIATTVYKGKKAQIANTETRSEAVSFILHRWMDERMKTEIWTDMNQN